jgi:phenylalanyl-tRNA synthetase beta chain
VAGRPSRVEVDALEALLPAQPRHAAGLLAGERDRSGWWGGGRRADWSDAIGIVRELAEELGVQLEVSVAHVAPWHPGRCAAFSSGDRVLGYAGELHPRVIGEVGLPARSVAFEIDIDALLALVDVTPAPAISTMPVAKEDLALVVEAGVAAEDVRRALQRGGGPLVESVRLFDTYSGEQVGPGRTSLAFALRFRAPDRTLTADEVAAAREAALAAAAAECGAVLRA